MRKDEQMTITKMGMALACVLALTACQDFRKNGADGVGGNGVNGVDPNLVGANDPTSVAYFNQTNRPLGQTFQNC